MTESLAQYPIPLHAPPPSTRPGSGLSADSDTVPRFVADPLVVADPQGWIPATDLVSGAGLEALFDLPHRLWAAPPHAAAVLAWKKYAYRLAQPLAAAWTLAREIPLLSADNVLIQLSRAAPYITVGLHRATSTVLPTSPAARSYDAIVSPDEAAQLAFLSSTLIDQHLRPLIERTMKARRANARTLWGQAAAAFAYAFTEISATAAAETARFTALLPIHDLAGVGPDDTVWRSTCCLALASPGLAPCRDCVTANRRPAKCAPGAAG